MLLLLWRILVFGWAVRTSWLAAAYAVSRPGVARHHVESAVYILGALLILTLVVMRWRLGPAPPPSGAPARSPRLVDAIVLVAAAMIIYWPALSIGLLSDDFILIDRAERGVLIDGSWEMVRPAPLALWALVAQALPASWLPPTLHAVNVVLHGVNAGLIGALLIRFGAATVVARFAAGAFLVFPAAVEPVAWASGVFDVMLTTLTVGAAYLALRPGASVGPMLLVAGLTGLALLTKETAIAVPVLTLVAGWVGARVSAPHIWRITAATAIPAAVYVGWRLATGIPSGVFPPLGEYAAKELLTRPFGALAIPFHQALIEQMEVVVAACVGAVPLVAAAGLLWRARPSCDQSRLVAGSVVWVLAAAAPTFTWFFVGADLQGSRYTYLPAVGWVMFGAGLAAGGRAWWPLLRYVAVTLASVWLLVCVVAVRAHLSHWTDAARVRDEILATQLRRGASCGQPPLASLPEHIGGAYVFRNGLTEAMRRHCPR